MEACCARLEKQVALLTKLVNNSIAENRRVEAILTTLDKQFEKVLYGFQEELKSLNPTEEVKRLSYQFYEGIAKKIQRVQ